MFSPLQFCCTWGRVVVKKMDCYQSETCIHVIIMWFLLESKQSRLVFPPLAVKKNANMFYINS